MNPSGCTRILGGKKPQGNRERSSRKTGLFEKIGQKLGTGLAKKGPGNTPRVQGKKVVGGGPTPQGEAWVTSGSRQKVGKVHPNEGGTTTGANCRQKTKETVQGEGKDY